MVFPRRPETMVVAVAAAVELLLFVSVITHSPVPTQQLTAMVARCTELAALAAQEATVSFRR
jgi:hypothetical protein